MMAKKGGPKAPGGEKRLNRELHESLLEKRDSFGEDAFISAMNFVIYQMHDETQLSEDKRDSFNRDIRFVIQIIEQVLSERSGREIPSTTTSPVRALSGDRKNSVIDVLKATKWWIEEAENSVVKDIAHDIALRLVPGSIKKKEIFDKRAMIKDVIFRSIEDPSIDVSAELQSVAAIRQVDINSELIAEAVRLQGEAANDYRGEGARRDVRAKLLKLNEYNALFGENTQDGVDYQSGMPPYTSPAVIRVLQEKWRDPFRVNEYIRIAGKLKRASLKSLALSMTGARSLPASIRSAFGISPDAGFLTKQEAEFMQEARDIIDISFPKEKPAQKAKPAPQPRQGQARSQAGAHKQTQTVRQQSSQNQRTQAPRRQNPTHQAQPRSQRSPRRPKQTVIPPRAQQPRPIEDRRVNKNRRRIDDLLKRLED